MTKCIIPLLLFCQNLGRIGPVVREKTPKNEIFRYGTVAVTIEKILRPGQVGRVCKSVIFYCFSVELQEFGVKTSESMDATTLSQLYIQFS